MKILPVSEFSYNKNKTDFGAKKDKKSEPQVVTNSIKKAVPTAALILAMMAEPVAVEEAEAATLNNENMEMQWRPQGPSHRPSHRPHHYHFHPVPPPTYYYNPYNYILPTVIMMNYLQNVASLNNVYARTVNPVSVGNVTFNKNDIKAVNAYSYEGVQYHNVILNNGTNVTYPEQPDENYAVIYRNNEGYKFEGLSDAYIEGSDNRDVYTLNGCKNTTVNVGDDNRNDKVLIQRYRITPVNTRQYTENVSVTADKGDVVNNRVVRGYETTSYDGY